MWKSSLPTTREPSGRRAGVDWTYAFVTNLSKPGYDTMYEEYPLDRSQQKYPVDHWHIVVY